ncbi:hypothetical protein H2248_001620 [Termitomyces sp. 'cryptogamus']|nr:hypothetical protein H2248_001620 [Termitomyces sp. 'cryptogamus']
MESTPLLAIGRQEPVLKNKTTVLIKEMRKITLYAFPAFASQLLEFSLVIVEVVSVGHISTSVLGAATLGSMTANVTGYGTLLGLTSALDTVLPSAFKSAQPRLVGLWAQRMSVIVFFALMPILAIWLNAESILLYITQEPEIARYAALYLRWLAMGLPAFGLNCIFRRYFQSQGLFAVQTQINLIVAPVNVFLNYLLVWGPETTRLGFIGAPISTSLSHILVSVISIIYGIHLTPRNTWHPVSIRMFTNLSILVRLGIAGVGQTAAEWWAWELLALAATFLDPPALASQSILLTSSSITYQAPYALSNAAVIRVGNLLGEKNAKQVSIAARASILIAFIISLILSLMFLVFKGVWAYMFSDDPEVISLVASVLPVIALYQIVEGNAAVTSGILRAKGQQAIGAALNISGYYLIGLPFGVWLAFYCNMRLHGLWMGMAVALTYCSVIGSVLCHRTNWDYEIAKVIERMENEDQLHFSIDRI